jgi:peptidoglycan/LPS O-acetylase OafA/YrhL
LSRGEQRPAGARIPALDGIRGIAILCVMLYHFTFYGGIEPTLIVDKVYYHTALVGWFGVDLFFVLSGFLITGILYDTASAPQYFRNFYARRVLRIFPLYYGTLAVFFFLIPLVIDISDTFEELLRDQLWYWSYLVNVQIALEYWPSFFALGHFWSLAVEEQFYLVWPLVVFFLKRRSLIAICVVCIVGAFLVRVGRAGDRRAAGAARPGAAWTGHAVNMGLAHVRRCGRRARGDLPGEAGPGH